MGLDVSMAKRIRIQERKSLTLRIDTIDVLNKPQWGNPNVDINNVNFGRMASATGNRTFALSIRFEF